MQVIIQPYSSTTFGEALKNALRGDLGSFERFSAAVAFVKASGVRHIEQELAFFGARGGSVLFVAGIDRQGTSVEGMEQLLRVVSSFGEVYVNYCTDAFVTFHPKLYFLENETEGLLLVGSGNLTEGGLYLNDEAFLMARLDYKIQEDRALGEQVRSIFEQWKVENGHPVVPELLELLAQNGLLISETVYKDTGDAPEEIVSSENEPARKKSLNPDGLFQRSVRNRSAPRKVRPVSVRKPSPKKGDASEPVPAGNSVFSSAFGFVMTLQPTDVGAGQKTVGAGRRSPEVFIPLAARDSYPEFWGWKDFFTEDRVKSGKYDRKGVRCRIGGEIIEVNMMTWPDKHDFRLRSETLRSAGNPGDILRMEKTSPDTSFDYYIEIIPFGTSAYEDYLALCSEAVRNSQKRWGYYGF